MFHASHPFAFLDYHRVPYAVTEDPRGTGASPLPFLGRLRAAGIGDEDGRTLWWLRSDAAGDPPAGCVLGRHRLGEAWLVGHVVPDRVAVDWLPRIATGWRPVLPLHDERGARVASVWRDDDGDVLLPFDPGEVMDLLWSERYQAVTRSRAAGAAASALRRGYYLAKPAIPRSAQLALRRRFTRVQSRAAFPRWPVEDSLHDLYDWLLAVLADLRGGPVPWLGAWPGGRSWALVLTHDVETDAGVRNMHLLRDPERAAGYRSSWNFVPERYTVDAAVLASLREEGCEVGVHGLRHDGRDLGPRKVFEQRLPAIRDYARRWGATGFRSPATQRVWEWMPELGFDYDSSYTDTDPYEPQAGGCCSYLPFFNQEQVELPITLPQDHTLFVILQQTDGDLWVDKARHIRDRGGMALALAHPDYAVDARLVSAWSRLLAEFRDDDTAWRASPGEVAAWWRRRAASTLREDGDGWRVEGPAAADGVLRFAEPGTTPAALGAVR